MQKWPADKCCWGCCEVPSVLSPAAQGQTWQWARAQSTAARGLFSLAVPLLTAFFTLFNSSSFWMLREPWTGNSLEIIYRAHLVDLYSRLQTHREINSFYIQNVRLLLSFIAVKIYFEGQSNHHDFKSPYYKVYVTPIWPPHLSNDQTLN